MTTPTITPEERKRFWDRYYNRQVCSPPQNYCRNDVLLDEVGRALSAAEARIERLEQQVERDVDFLAFIQFSGASFRCPSCGGQLSSGHSPECALVAVQRTARAALEGETMPTTDDALCVISSAKRRLILLGWREGQYCPKGGEEFAVIEWGCTGIFPAVYHGEWPNGSLLYCDGFYHPHGCMYKPLANLTDAERKMMNECIDRDRVIAGREARAALNEQKG